MSFDISKYREMFLEEAEELFESADNVLLVAENNGSLTDEEMGQLFRDVHTLKGSGASVELALFAEFTHDVENLMDKLRNHKIEFIPEMAETLIDGLDVMKEILDLEVADNLTRETFTKMTSALLEEIRAYSNGTVTVTKKVEVEVAKPVETPKVVEIKKETPVVLDSDNFGFFDDDLNEQRDSKNKAYGIFADDDIDEVHQNFGFYDDELETISNNTKDIDKISEEDKENFGFFDDMPELTSNSVMETNDIKEEVVIAKKEPIEESASNNVPQRKQRVKEEDDDASSKKAAVPNNNNSIRVNLDKIDLLMNNVGDLVITNAMLTQFSSTIEETKTRNSVLERLELLERHIRDMQDSIMSIRMVPMESIYSKFPKVVRDISKKLGKKVEFKHYGDNVEIDKAMIEGLTDPLMHIIRNSLDHGIETPTEREKTGKPEVGSISITAEQANGQMIITIEDDGRGVNSERVAKKALENGLIDENQYNTMTENEKAMLIFGAGLSTADTITDISGRGVGMDVVKTNIQKLGGVIKLDSHLGVGTTITTGPLIVRASASALRISAGVVA